MPLRAQRRVKSLSPRAPWWLNRALASMSEGFGMLTRSYRHPALVAIALSLSIAPAAAQDARLIVKLNADAGKSALTSKARIEKTAVANGIALRHVRPMTAGADVVAVSGDSTAIARAIDALTADPGVAFVQRDRRRHPDVNDQYAGAQQYLSNAPGGIGATSAWNITHGSSSIVVAVLDTGYRPHAGMAGRLLPGWDMISDVKTANDGDGRDPDASDPGDFVLSSEATDECGETFSSWHGTSVAGIIAANTDDGAWTAGIDWAARILPVRVLGKCGGYDSDIADGIAWASGVAVPGVPANPTPAHVINLSLGGDESCPPIYPLVMDAAYAHGVTRAIVVAAGNAAGDVADHSPANCRGAIAVAATTLAGNLAGYSNSGAGITISAPGGTYARQFGSIVALSNTGRTSPGDDAITHIGGTSMAAPMVSGTVSLMLAVAPALSADQVLSILKRTAKPFPAGSDCSTARCGAGIVNADAAVREAASLAGVATPNYEGLWWRSPAGSEAGWGLNVAHQDDVIFATWFTYDATGKAWWLSMTANRSASNVFSGTLYQTRGPAFSAMPFEPSAVTATPVGTGTLTFGDNGNGTFDYTVNGVQQIKPITREVFGPLPACAFGASTPLSQATNYQDLWWASPPGSESGWGVNFTHQGDIIFATWFTYDTDGTPLWLSATTNRSAPATYTGTLYRTTGPAFNALPFDPARVVATPVGTLTLSFANGSSGTFAYVVNGVAQSKPITRQVFRTPGTLCQ
jgi:serine protease